MLYSLQVHCSLLHYLCMTTREKVEALIEQVSELPDDAQAEFVDSLLEMRAEQTGIYHVDDAEREALARSAEDVRHGRFASECGSRGDIRPLSRRMKVRYTESANEENDQLLAGIAANNPTAAAAVADYFVANQLEPVTIFHGPLASSATRERVSGFVERFQATAQRPEAVTCYALENFSKEEGYRRSQPLFAGAAPPRSIFCTSDEIAYGVARAGREAGLRTGRDITLFGFDGRDAEESRMAGHSGDRAGEPAVRHAQFRPAGRKYPGRNRPSAEHARARDHRIDGDGG